MHYILYDKSTGNIIKTGVCSKNRFEMLSNGREGDFILDNTNTMEGIANDITQRIVDNKVVDKNSVTPIEAPILETFAY